MSSKGSDSNKLNQLIDGQREIIKNQQKLNTRFDNLESKLESQPRGSICSISINSSTAQTPRQDFTPDMHKITPDRPQPTTFCDSNSPPTRNKAFAGGIDGTGQKIAILTSGGDAQGMNSAIRASVRMALYTGARAFSVKWGYQGLVDGGDNIKEVGWEDVTGITYKGGTVFGSARSKDFPTWEGRKKSAYNLVTLGITNLIVIGGDGSLTGANHFRKQWPTLLEELVAEGKITQEVVDDHGYLNIVGMVGSIDNDFCGTDMTIGADSALHRVIECVDCITTTAESHQRSFILEVMGRNCGYLALVAGIGVGADAMFIPEMPPEDGWEERLCDNLKQIRDSGRLLSIILVSEGAIDSHGKAISSNYIKELLSTQLNFDTRVTVLGHVQRGGTPSAFDRLLACRFGAEAALSVLEATRDSEPVVMCLKANKIIRRTLDECVQMCNDIKAAYEEGDTNKVIELRGSSFQASLRIYNEQNKMGPPPEVTQLGENCHRFVIMNVGAPASGMNPAVRSFVRSVLFNGHQVIGVSDGFDGLLKNQFRQMTWKEVDTWASAGGSFLSVSRATPKIDIEKVNEIFVSNKFHALMIVGGFEGYESILQMYEAREKYPGFRIPMMLIPATMSNNVPGSMFSLGADTTLNVIVQSCDNLRQSASSSADRVFVVETMGGKCGYLATMAGIAGAADAAYIFEEPFSIRDLQNDVTHLMYKFQKTGMKRGLILRNEKANANYTTEFINKMYEEEAKGVFITRSNVLGHIQQGGSPSPFDRLYGVRLAKTGFEFLLNEIKKNIDGYGQINCMSKESAVVLGTEAFRGKTNAPVVDLKEDTDFKNRIPKNQWWLQIRPLLRIMARHTVSEFNREQEKRNVQRNLSLSPGLDA